MSENIGNAIFCHFFLANTTNKTHATNPQGNVIPKDFFPKYIVFEESYGSNKVISAKRIKENRSYGTEF